MDFMNEQCQDSDVIATSAGKSDTGLRKHHKDLSMNDILYLLKSKVQPGHQLPAHLNAPPWRIKDCNNKENVDLSKINSLLVKSWEAQSSTIPQCDGHGDFSDFIVSNSSLAVSGLIKTYLNTLGISNVSLIFGCCGRSG